MAGEPRFLQPAALAMDAPRLHRIERRRRLAGILYLAPGGLLFFAVYVFPIAQMLLTSLFDPHFTLQHYRHLFSTPVYLWVMLITFRIAAIVTLLCLLLGYPVAYLIATSSPRRTRLLLGLVLLPFWTSVLVRNYAWLALLSRNGVVNKLLLRLGLISEPLPLMFNATGVAIGMTYILIPFMILALYSVMTGINRDLLRAAASLGAGPFECFVKVFLPLSLPGVAAGSALVFIMGAGFFITPALLGGGRVPMIGTLIESQIRGVLNWGLGSAISTVLLIAVLALFAVYVRLLGSENLLGSGGRAI